MMLQPQNFIRFRGVSGLVLCVFSISFVTLLFQFHGFSTGIWGVEIEHRQSPEVILGKSRPIRGDDWGLELPEVHAQIQHNPPFPRHSDLIGLGSNQVANVLKLPVQHSISFFRPQAWGYFISFDFGLSFFWVSTALLLFFGMFGAIRVFFPEQVWLPGAIAAFRVLSPMVQHWSFHYMEVEGFALLSFTTFTYFVRSKTPWRTVGNGLLFVYFAGCFILNVYPPFQILHGYLVLILSAIWMRLFWSDVRVAIRRPLVWATLGFASAVLLGAGYDYYSSIKDEAHRMLQTEYPGTRFFKGGGMALKRVLLNNFFPPFSVFGPARFSWDRISGNICEAASGCFFFLITLPIFFLERRKFKSAPVFPVLVGLSVYLVFLFFFSIGQFPDFFVKYTLLSQVNPNRLYYPFETTDLLFLGLLFCAVRESRIVVARWAMGVTAVVALLFLVPVAIQLRDLNLPWFCAGLGIAVSLALILSMNRPRNQVIWCGLVFMLYLAAGASFNPINRRGASRYLMENPLSQAIRESHQKGRWASYVQYFHFSSFIRALGLPSVTGFYSVPDDKVFAILDPENKYRFQWNRSAGVQFNFPTDGFRIETSTPNRTHVLVFPDDPKLEKLGIDHLLVDKSDETKMAAAKHWKLVKEVPTASGFLIYRRNQRASSGLDSE